MRRVFMVTGAAVLASGLLVGAGADLHAQSQSRPQAQSGGDAGLKVQRTDPERAMENLLEAVEDLREASVLLLNQQEGAQRQKAFEAAQEATIMAQRAMVQLPPELRIPDAKSREAKEWPTAAGRLDKAAQDLEAAIKAVQKESSGKNREAAVKTMRAAMSKVQDALAAIPAWEAGAQSASGQQN